MARAVMGKNGRNVYYAVCKYDCSDSFARWRTPDSKLNYMYVRMEHKRARGPFVAVVALISTLITLKLKSDLDVLKKCLYAENEVARKAVKTANNG